MDAINLLREQLQWAHELIFMTIGDATKDQAHVTPPGTANPIAATYAHAILAEDAVVNAMLQGGAPLFGSSWQGRTGTSDPQWAQSPEWARSVQVDLPVLTEYARAVAAASDTYVSKLSEADLDKSLDLSAQGLGQRTLGWALHALVIGHLHNMAGEISALKGTQGLKGYPF